MQPVTPRSFSLKEILKYPKRLEWAFLSRLGPGGSLQIPQNFKGGWSNVKVFQRYPRSNKLRRTITKKSSNFILKMEKRNRRAKGALADISPI